MNIVDSSGWLEYFIDGPNADEFEIPLLDLKHLIVPSIIVFEVFKVILRERDEKSALLVSSLMKQGKIVDLNFQISIQASKISHKNKIPMADSIILSTAYNYNAIIWTQDIDFKNFKCVKYFPAIK